MSDVLAAVLTRDPALAALPAGTPGAVRRLLRRYLERDPRQRLRDIGDARLALADEYGRAFAVSPDGSKLVYAVEAGPTSALRIRSLDSPCRRRSQARTGVWMTAFIADAVRESLARRRTGPNQPPVRLTTLRGSGLQPGVDLDDIAALQDLMNETDAASGR